MKKIIVPFSILAVSAAAFMVGCKQDKKVAPVADKELQSSVQVSHAVYAFLDAEQIVSFVGDQDQAPKFYMAVEGSSVVLVTNNPPSNPDVNNPDPSWQYSFGYKDQPRICVDGRKRDGTLSVGFSVSKNPSVNNGYPPYYRDRVNENSIWFRRYGFTGYLHFAGYIVDDWKITETNGNFEEPGQGSYVPNILIINELTSDKFMGATSNIKWTIKGHYKIQKGKDSTLCHINMTKELLSSNNASVYTPGSGGTGSDPGIKWGFINPNTKEGVKVGYYGTVSGFMTTSEGYKPFSFEIKKEQMLVRDFGCYPDQISGITVSPTGSITSSQKEEYHPFINGIASFTVGNSYPRQIYYGGSESAGAGQCDNNGAVLIKGISYPVSFIK